MLADGDGHGGRVDHIGAGGGDRHVIDIPCCGNGTGHALNAVLCHLGDVNGAALIPPAQHRRKGQCQFPQQRVVSVEDGQTACLQVLKDLTLGLQNALPGAAQIFNMGVAHIGDHGHGGTYYLTQIADLTEVVHAGLNDGGLMLRRQIQKRQRRTDGVVEVGLGFQCREPPAQYRGDHLLGGGLSGGACDLHHRKIKLFPVPRCQRFQRCQSILHPDVKFAVPQDRGLFCCQTACRTAGKGRIQIVVAVKPLTGQRNKQRAFRDAAAVSGDRCDHCAAVLQQCAAHGGTQLLYGTGFHRLSAFLAASESITIFSHRSA